jgi:drug/metabolite transporter (DMT)-like permease
MPQARLKPQQILVLAFVSISSPLGDACLSRGMTHMPEITVAHPLSLITAVFTPWIACGILLLIGYFASYLTALSWADLTYVIPATSLGYVFMALLAHFWLREPISIQRWAGIALITLGAGFVAQGPANTTSAANTEKLDAEPGSEAGQ